MKKNAAIDQKHPFLVALGVRVRNLRAQLGITRKTLSHTARISERHLANLEGGTGNVSILILVALANALEVSVSDLMGDGETSSAGNGQKGTVASRRTRIAFIGLRGAGKSTLGGLVAKDLGYRFVEVSREIELLAGCGLSEIYNLYGAAAYRRYERQAIQAVLATNEPVVIATPGGVVSEDDTFALLLKHCTTVWLKAKPLDHLSRVRAQGDNRPMAATRLTQRVAIDDLKSILQAREPLYARADFTFDTSEYALSMCQRLLLEKLR